MGSEQDDRSAVSVATQPLDRLASVKVRKPHVHDDEIGRSFHDRLQRRLRGLDRLDLELRVQIELFDQRVTQVGVVVHDQYSSRLIHHRSLPAAPSGG